MGGLADLRAAFDYASQPTEPVPTCPVCGRMNTPRPVRDRYGFRLGMARCACSFSYLSPRLTRDAYARFYAEFYRPLVAAVSVPTAAADLPAAMTRYGQQLAQVFSAAAPSGAILDVGGSTGACVQAWATGRADTITVLDPNPTELAQARARGCSTVCLQVEDLPTLDHFAMTFAGVFCIQTLDHLSEPLLALRAMRAVVNPGGWLLVDYVRAAKWPVGGACFIPIAVRQGVKLDHPCYWTAPSVRLALTASGWTIVKRATSPTKEVLLCRTS